MFFALLPAPLAKMANFFTGFSESVTDLSPFILCHILEMYRLKKLNWPRGILTSKTETGHKSVTTIIYIINQPTPFSIPESINNFLPMIPQRLPPKANVDMMSNKFHPFTFHLPCNFLNMLQKCRKHCDKKMIFFCQKKVKESFTNT